MPGKPTFSPGDDKDRPSLRLHESLREIRAAVLFLTRIPVGWQGDYPGSMHRRSQLWFPMVGAAIGLVGAGILVASLWLGFAPPLAVMIALSAQIILTGGLHEDGLADVTDGFGGGATREAKLSIMRDSRVGTYGALVLIMAIAMRAIALWTIGTTASWAIAGAALVAAGTLSRAAILPLTIILPPARSDGIAAGAGSISKARLSLALVSSTAIAFLVLQPAVAVIAVLVCALAGGAIALLARRQIGGYTGDVLGAAQQIAEIAALLAISAVAT